MAKKRKTKRPRVAPDPISAWARAVWLAGLGALATERKKRRGRFDRLVARGARASEEGAPGLDALGLARRADLERVRAGLQALEARLARLAGSPPPEPVVFRLAPLADGWAVTRDGAGEPLERHATKKQALAAGRRYAGRAAPSRLVVHGLDGAELGAFDYES